MDPPAVGVVGASGRAAVGSLLRAGFAAWAVDLFADRDLRRMAPCVRCPAEDYPHALPELTDSFPPGPVLYTGGLESHPAVVGELARRRSLWGNASDVLRRARDPLFLAEALVPAGITETPRTSLPDVAPGSGRWMWKSRRSAGGSGVQFARPGGARPRGCYLQEFIDGPAMSAQFLSSAGRTVLLGVTEQLVGEPWLHARSFAYCGNVGPALVSSELRDTLMRLGDAVGRRAGLRGLWGVDFVLRDGLPWPVEVNPRYTAALEVLEHGCGFAPLADHANAFSPAPHPIADPPRPKRTVGKAIYFAPRGLVFPGTGPWETEFAEFFDPWRLPAFADIPGSGEVIEPGHPVLTFFAIGSTADECRSRLQSTAAELDRLFGRESPSGAEVSP